MNEVSILTIWASELPDRPEVQWSNGCARSGMNEYVQEVQKRGSLWYERRFGKLPLKRLTTEAIEIADSHGGNNSIWYRIRD